MFKRIVCFLLLISAVISLFSCEEDVSFSHSEFVITLDSDFSQGESDDYDLLLKNGEVSVGVLRYSFAAAVEQGISDTYSPFDFAEYTIAEKEIEGNVYIYRDIPYYTSYEILSGIEYYTFYTFYRSKYAYFMTVYAVPRAKENTWREKFFEFADTVYFTS